MLLHLLRAIFTIPRFWDYKPQQVTVRRIFKWLKQYDRKDWGLIVKLLEKVIFYSESKTNNALLRLNSELHYTLKSAGLPMQKLIYVQIHDAGSSSPVMLNLIRDGALLERKGCSFVDGKDVRKLYDLTNTLGEGAIIYVDDFSGTGNQFCEAHNFLKEYIIGNFSEFFLLPCICEEAYDEINGRGITIISDLIHKKADRVLHQESRVLDEKLRTRLIELCQKIDKKNGLGYKKLATMVVFYRNTPNTVPLILRGNQQQKPFCGILPRTTDLPPY